MNRIGYRAATVAAAATTTIGCAGLARGVVICVLLVSERCAGRPSGPAMGGRSLTNVNLDVACALHGCGLCGPGRCELGLALLCEEGASLSGLLFLLRRARPHTRLLR
jgi:hypothetical protein